jgi:hypothetical protein
MRCFHDLLFQMALGEELAWYVGPVDATHRLDVCVEGGRCDPPDSALRLTCRPESLSPDRGGERALAASAPAEPSAAR